ncbi:MAG: hypothetical protein IJD99_05680 [Clostridia bacterium]|nr:hypothetical protein [Clostridia bacterium]
MANQKFCGAVASQAYRWGYICEYCKQPVEKKNYISTQVGSMHKSTTWVTTTAAGAKGDDFRKAMYSRISDGCKLTFDGGEGEQVWGYWPQKATQYAADTMTLFYTVPEGTEASALTFTLNNNILNNTKYQFNYNP